MLTLASSYMDAKQELLSSALIDRSLESVSLSKLSVHRLIQAAVLRYIPKADRLLYFGYAVDILLEMFPATRKGDFSEYLFTKWEICESCIHHVFILKDRLQEFRLTPLNKRRFAELLNRAAQ
jgi:hypothetical protein